MTPRTIEGIQAELRAVEEELDRLAMQRLGLEAEHLALRAELRAAERLRAMEQPYDARIFSIIDGTPDR